MPIVVGCNSCDMDKIPSIVWAKKRNSEYYSNDDIYIKLSGSVIEIGEMYINEEASYSFLKVKIQCDDMKNYNKDYNENVDYYVFTSNMIDLLPGDEIEFVFPKYNRTYQRCICPLVVEIEKEGNVILDISEGKELLLKYVTDIHYK